MWKNNIWKEKGALNHDACGVLENGIKEDLCVCTDSYSSFLMSLGA